MVPLEGFTPLGPLGPTPPGPLDPTPPGPLGPTPPGITLPHPPVAFPEGWHGFLQAVALVMLGHPSVSFPSITHPAPMSIQPPGATPCAGAGQGAPAICTHPLSMVMPWLPHSAPPIVPPPPQTEFPMGIPWGGQGVPPPPPMLAHPAGTVWFTFPWAPVP